MVSNALNKAMKGGIFLAQFIAISSVRRTVPGHTVNIQ